MLVGTPPRIPNELIGAEVVLPIQWASRRPRATTGPRALAGALLEAACREAGVLPHRGPLPDRRRQLARQWLLGELEHQFAVPVAVACAAVGIDPAALAAVVRRHAG
jgi:hypothetical protein